MGTFHGVTTNYGLCVKGPWNGKNLAHAGAVYQVAIDTVTKKPVVALQGPGRGHPEGSFKFGRYVWQPALSEWRWDESVGRSETEKRD